MNSLCKSQSSSGSLSCGMSISVLSLINANYLIAKVQRHVYFDSIVIYFYFDWCAAIRNEQKQNVLTFFLKGIIL